MRASRAAHSAARATNMPATVKAVRSIRRLNSWSVMDPTGAIDVDLVRCCFRGACGAIAAWPSLPHVVGGEVLHQPIDIPQLLRRGQKNDAEKSISWRHPEPGAVHDQHSGGAKQRQ